MSGPTPRPKPIELNIQQEFYDSSNITSNIGQDVIVTTADKVRLCLLGHEKAIKARIAWTAPLGVLLALLPSLVAADFKPFLALRPEEWKAVFVVGSIATAVWLLQSLWSVMQSRGKGDIEVIIRTLMERSQTTTSKGP